MRDYLTPLIQLQRLFIPCLIVLTAWAVWRTVFRKDLSVGLALYLALIVVVDGYMNTGIYLPGLEKGSIRYSEICALFLLANRLPLPPQRQSLRSVHWLVWAYFATLFLSALRTDSMTASLFEFRRLIAPQIVAFMVARRGLDSPEAYRRFFLSLTSLVLVIGLFVFWDLFFDRWLLKSDMLDKSIYSHNRALKRFGSFFLNPNYLGAFIVLVFPVLLVWVLNDRRTPARILGMASLLALVFCLVQTQSRAGLLAFAVGLILLVVGPCGGISRRRRVGFLALIVALFAVFMPGFYQHASKRFSTPEAGTATAVAAAEARSRETTWAYTIRIIADHPVLGIGFGEFRFVEAMQSYGFEDEFGVESLDAPHNSYLQAAAYAGLPALLTFLLANFIVIFRAGLICRRADQASTATIFGFAVGIAGFLASIFPDLQLFTQTVAPVYWVFFALLLSLTAAASAQVDAAQSTPATAQPVSDPRRFNPQSRPQPQSWKPVRPQFVSPRTSARTGVEERRFSKGSLPGRRKG